ncbi:hypothetical protein DRO66_08265, partial [Candidatus Bathyarchaeota archaeon]
MPYCEKCGNEIDEETTFCPKCGANVKTPVIAHRRPRSSGRNSTTILAIFFGGIIIPPKKMARMVVLFRPELLGLRCAMTGVLTFAPHLG